MSWINISCYWIIILELLILELECINWWFYRWFDWCFLLIFFYKVFWISFIVLKSYIFKIVKFLNYFYGVNFSEIGKIFSIFLCVVL